MGLLGKILLNEGITIFRCDVLIKTEAEQNKVEVYNEIRALEGVVVVTVEQSDFLDAKATNQYEYSLLNLMFSRKIKFYIRFILYDCIDRFGVIYTVINGDVNFR